MRPAPSNVRFDVQLLAPHVDDAELRFVIPMLGQSFFDALVIAKGSTISNYNPAVGAVVSGFSNAAYETLWKDKGLMRFCALSVLHEAEPYIGVQHGANGLQLVNAEFSENAGIDGVKFMQQELIGKLERLEKSILTFLCANKVTYPLFDNAACPSDECGNEEASFCLVW
ncbi:MAG: hypothetical protein HC874_14205 [Richelia sp. SL_2_1]|nr:hypothetical protein [Richelia sp. SL_2_1]